MINGDPASSLGGDAVCAVMLDDQWDEGIDATAMPHH
jgi:hypothetical protein